MAKRGPKGAWKVKGRTRDDLFKLFEENASVGSARIADELFERTGVRVSSSRIRDFRGIWKRGSSIRPMPTALYSKRAQARPSSNP